MKEKAPGEGRRFDNHPEKIRLRPLRRHEAGGGPHMEIRQPVPASRLETEPGKNTSEKNRDRLPPSEEGCMRVYVRPVCTRRSRTAGSARVRTSTPRWYFRIIFFAQPGTYRMIYPDHLFGTAVTITGPVDRIGLRKTECR